MANNMVYERDDLADEVELCGLDWVANESPETQDFYSKVLHRICAGLVTERTRVSRITYIMPATFQIEMSVLLEEEGGNDSETDIIDSNEVKDDKTND